MRAARGNKGFSLIELLVAIAIMGILAAIAIPGYLGYQLTVKKKVVVDNYDSAVRRILAELNKCSMDLALVSTNILNDLNQNGKRSPWDNNILAFTSGPLDKGQVKIDRTDIKSLCNTDTWVIISADTDGSGTQDAPYRQSFVSTGL